jgi:hypothetical protein
MNPPKVATKPKIRIATIMEEPEEFKPLRILDNADIFFLKKTRLYKDAFFRYMRL